MKTDVTIAILICLLENLCPLFFKEFVIISLLMAIADYLMQLLLGDLPVAVFIENPENTLDILLRYKL